MAWPLCDVCNRSSTDGGGVFSSSLGAVSFAYCRECLSRGAEPLWMWHTTLFACGGPDDIRRDLKEQASSWINGTYVDWKGIVASYKSVGYGDPRKETGG